MKSKIIIDSLSLLSSLTGIGRYTYEISKYLIEKKELECSFFYGYFSTKLITVSSEKKIKSLKSYLVKNQFVKAIVRKILFMLSGIFSDKYDLYWEPNFIPLKNIRSKKTVVTVHDFSWEMYPEFQPSERVKYFKKNFYLQIEKCDHIITGSNFTKQEIVDRVKCNPDKISVIFHGIDHKIFYNKLLAKPNQKYILAVGSLEPRKNLKNLLLAYSLLNDYLKNEFHLILVGASGWNNIEIKSMIDNLKQWVTYSGYVSDEALAILYNQASLFVYPSVYEGFGIPPLESMACGTPVICSNRSSLPEVGGDAVIYCDPNSIEDISIKIELVLNDESLQEEMIQKGLFRAKKFSWAKSAQEHIKVFEEVLKN